MRSSARTAALRHMPRQNSGVPGAVILMAIISAVVLLIFLSHSKPKSFNMAQPEAVPAKPVHLVFDPPVAHNDLQKANEQMVVDIIRDPSSWGLKDKAPIDLSGNILQVYLATLETENHFYHFANSGAVQFSYTGCCEGIGQVYTKTQVCESWELKDIRRNAWCSARIFANYYDLYKLKAPKRAFELTVARYKNAVLMNENKTAMILDEKGLPIITGDPNDPESPRSQVNRVFIDPDTGKSMFRFVPD